MQWKYLPDIKSTLSFLLFSLAVMPIWSDEPSGNKVADPDHEIIVPSAHGGHRGLRKIAVLPCKGAKGAVFTREAQVVLVPETGCVWVGLPNSQCFLLNSSVLGITPLGGPDGGNLLVRISTNKLASLDKTAKTDTIRKHLDNYLDSVNGESVTPTAADKSIPLSQLFGRSALMNLDRSDGAKPVQILSVDVNNTEIDIKMKSDLGTILALTLDNELNPVKATVNDRTTFEPGKIQPPSLIEELRSTTDKRRH